MAHDRTSIHIGDMILASDDSAEHPGEVVGYLSDNYGVKAIYRTLDDTYFDVDYDDIVSVTHQADCPSANKQEPASPPTPETAEDLVKSKAIWPGKIVTWSGAKKAGFSENRLFVILSFKKGSGNKAANICPLNGSQSGEPNRFDYYHVPNSNLRPVKFSAPLVKIVRQKDND